MNRILIKKELAPKIKLIEFENLNIALKAKPGQFVVIQMGEKGERFPITISGADSDKGTVKLIFNEVGRSSKRLGALSEGDEIDNVAGPLGNPTEIEEFGTVLCFGGGVMIGPMVYEVAAFKEAGNRVIAVIGARNKELLILKNEMKALSDDFYICTDDGSEGYTGLGFLTGIIEKENINQVIAMSVATATLRTISELTKPYGIKTIVSLTPIMLDGTGMCGVCRVSVAGETKFTCADGPEFDGHLVDWDLLESRKRVYSHEERISALVDEYIGKDFTSLCAGGKIAMAEKLKLNRIPMNKQLPEVRRRNPQEVAYGYTYEQAVEEAKRCIQCKKPACILECPVNVDIPSFVKAVAEGDLTTAAKIIYSTNSLPAICGRVCPQETQCEQNCALGKKGEPVSIGRLERFVSDWARGNPEESGVFRIDLPKATGKKVAIIGSGPAGLTCAADLARAGHKVVMYEALHRPGGVTIYGIPEFRLPKKIVQAEVNYLTSVLGVELKLNEVIGRSTSVDELLVDGYNAIFLGIGSGAPMFLNIPGENSNMVYSANEFLVRLNLMKAYLFPEYDTPVKVGKKVAVVGAGNVAMDAARWALRMGADDVYIVYRRTEAEMPARFEERENAKEEGVIFKLLTLPVRIIPDARGSVEAMECIEMELGEPDDSGRRRPIPKPGSEFCMEIDTCIPALGTQPNPLLPRHTPGLEITKRGTIVADEKGRTTKKGTWAGGDIVTGAATVISAMGAGKTAAADMNDYLKK